MLVIDTHPLCPTASSVTAALEQLIDKLVKLGCTVGRTNSNMPDLARTTRVYRELLSAVYSADLPPGERDHVEALLASVSLEDPSLWAAFCGA